MDYYRDILSELGLSAGECLMVGNDADEDMAAGQTGMQVFLLTDCLINRENRSLDLWPHGGFSELDRYIESLVYPRLQRPPSWRAFCLSNLLYLHLAFSVCGRNFIILQLY